MSGVEEVQRTVSLNPTFEGTHSAIGEIKFVHLKYCAFRINQCKHWHKLGHS